MLLLKLIDIFSKKDVSYNFLITSFNILVSISSFSLIPLNKIIVSLEILSLPLTIISFNLSAKAIYKSDER